MRPAHIGTRECHTRTNQYWAAASCYQPMKTDTNNYSQTLDQYRAEQVAPVFEQRVHIIKK